MARSTRLRWILLGGGALLAFAVGVARGMREEPAPARAPEPASAAAARPAPAAAARPAAPPPEPAPSAPRPEAEAPDPLREAIRAELDRDLAAHFPELKLSSDEVDAAADALVRLRAARLELKQLPRTAEYAERIRTLTREIGEAYADFEYVVEVDPAEFTERVDPGIDADAGDEEGEE